MVTTDTIIRKEDFNDPNSPINLALSEIEKDICNAMSKMREMKSIFDSMRKQLNSSNKDLTYGELEREYLDLLDQLAFDIVDIFD